MLSDTPDDEELECEDTDFAECLKKIFHKQRNTIEQDINGEF